VINGYPYSGTQKSELLRQSLNWRSIENATDLVHRVQEVETLHGKEFDRIKKEVKEGELIVTGEKAVAEQAEGLGGSFTYCTLGEPIELDRLLTGAELPSYAALGALLFHMATSQALPQGELNEAQHYLGATGGVHVWLIYRPDLEWLKSPEAALSLSFARAIAAQYPGQRHLVFAPARHVSQRMLDAEGLPVEFVPLPFALYRVERV
jgi:adenine-specific DNA-methyltransferase